MQIKCEMCGSTNIVKQEGFFVCQNCGIQYSLEEAKKLMSEGTAEVVEPVKNEGSDELANLYLLAKRAKEANDFENALKYYDQIIVKEPNSWEAQFYLVYSRAMESKIAGIGVASTNLTNTLKTVLGLIKDHVPKEQQASAINEISLRIFDISAMFERAVTNWFNKASRLVKGKFRQQYVNNLTGVANMLYVFGNKLEENFGEEYGSVAAASWKKGNEILELIIPNVKDKKQNKNLVNEYGEKIGKYDSTYRSPYKRRSISDMKKSIEDKKDSIEDMKNSIEDKKKFFGR